MSSHEDGRNGFKKGTGKPVGGDDFYKKRRGLVPQNDGDTGLFSKPVGDEPKTVTLSEENFKDLLRFYGQLHGIKYDEVESIIEGERSNNNGDVPLAKLRHAYAKMCNERGYFPRGHKG